MQADCEECGATKADVSEEGRRREFLLGTVAAIVAFMCIAFPRIAPLVVIAATLTVAALLVLDGLRSGAHVKIKTMLLRPEALFVTWALVACLWSAEPVEAVVKSVFLAALVAHAIVLVRQSDRIPPGDARALARGLLIGVIVGGVFLCFEIASRDAISRFILTYLPDLDRGFSKHMTVKDGVVVFASGANLTRSTGVFCLLWIPALLAATVHTRGATRWASYAVVALVCLTIVVHPHAQSQTAQLAIPVSAATLALAAISFKFARRAAAAAFLVAVVGFLPISLAMVSYDLHLRRDIMTTARARMIIWNYTSERILENPLLGVGTNSTRFIHDERVKAQDLAIPRRYVTAPATRAHPHNVYLQIWYEMGLVGVAAFAVLGLALLRRIDLLPPLSRPFAVASFAMCTVLITPTYGLWQSWFQSIFILSVLALILVAKSASAPPQTTGI